MSNMLEKVMRFGTLFRHAGSDNGTTAVTALSHSVARSRVYVLSASVANSGTSDAVVEIRSGTTVIWRLSAPAGSGSNKEWPESSPLPLNEAEDLTWRSTVASTSVAVSLSGKVGDSVPVATS